MEYATITVSFDQRHALITLNRPGRRNALDNLLIKELTEALQSANRNPQVRVVIIAGNGPAFCAGMDLAYLRKLSEAGQEENLEDARSLLRLLELVHGLKKPVIAMVDGAALGGGCGLAAACDFVIASREHAKMGAPEVRMGFLPAIILPYIIKRMGEGSAREFVLRGEILTAEQAKSRGLVTEVVDAAGLRVHVDEFARQLIRSASGSAITLTKELFSRFDEMDVKRAGEYAANLNALARKTEDFKRGIDAFLNKKSLDW